MVTGDFESRRKSVEELVLLVLGAVPDTPMSVLHLEKETFILYKFHPSIPKFVEFSAHIRGPYSEEISDAIRSPYYRTDDWEYLPPKKGDKYSSGYVRLTEYGLNAYKESYARMISQQKMHSLLAGVEIVRRVYGKLTPKELIYLIYLNYPEMTINSEIKKEIFADSKSIIKGLERKGLVSENSSDKASTMGLGFQ